MLWTRVRLRKRGLPTVCRDCRAPLPVGSFAFRPITNCNGRQDRLCSLCVPRGRRKLSDELFGDNEPTTGAQARAERRAEREEEEE